jgi:hypothetical protein
MKQPGRYFLTAALLAMATMQLSGCVAFTVASTAVSVAGTAVGVGLTVGSAAVTVASAGVRGVASAVSSDDTD